MSAPRERWHRRVHRRFRQSLKWRLVALFMALALATSLLFFVGTQRFMAEAFTVFARPLLADYVGRLADEIGSPPDVARARALADRLPLVVRIDGPQVNWSSRGEPDAEPWRWSEGSGLAEPRGLRALLTRQTADGHRVRFSIDDSLWRHPQRRSHWVTILGLLGLTAAAYVVTRRLFRPIEDIRAGALRYGQGDFSTPIPQRRPDELGELAGQVNRMADSLQGMLEGQRELLLAISHELRSPLTRARLNAELLDEGAERQALLRDVTLMGRLIADLLEGERLLAGASALQREPTDLNALVRDVVAAEFAGRAVRLDLADALPTLSLDRPRVTLLLRNLVDNACRHGAEAGEPVTVSTHAGPDGVALAVRDFGPGVPEAHLGRLTEPFYRPETARTRGTGGVGLGLYLCQRVAQSHGATFALHNAGPGLRAEVHWPLP